MAVEDNRVFDLGPLAAYPGSWFTRGVLRVTEGAGRGLVAHREGGPRQRGPRRRIELWSDLRVPIAIGTMVDITAGCDKRAETCREKFDNFLNFRGFPDIPGEDWLISYPTRAGRNDGGRLT